MLQVALPHDFLLEGMNVQWVHKYLYFMHKHCKTDRRTPGFLCSMFVEKSKSIASDVSDFAVPNSI